MIESCGTCKYADEFEDVGYIDNHVFNYKCHRFPRPYPESHPVVVSSDWCGEWKAKNE